MDLYRYYDLPDELPGYGQTDFLPNRIVNRVIHSQNQGRTYQLSDQERQSLLSDAKWALRYARVVQKPWPEAEPQILKNPISAFVYARDVIQGPWPAAEPVIAQNPDAAYNYAKYVLRAPFPQGEQAINSNRDTRTWYQHLLRDLASSQSRKKQSK